MAIATDLLRYRIVIDGATGDPLKELSKSAKQLEDDINDAGRAIDRIDGKDVDVNVNDAALIRLRAELARLREQVAQAYVIDIDADTRKLERTIRAVQAKIRVLTPDEKKKDPVEETLSAFASAGRQVAELAARSGLQFVSAFGRFISASAPELGLVIGGAIVLAAGAALAAGGGLTLGAIAGAGLTAGIIAAFQDPAVKAAAQSAGQTLLADFTTTLGAPLRGPLIQSIDIVSESLKALMDDVAPSITSLGPDLTRLAQNAGLAIEMLGPSINRAIEAAKPILAEIGANLPIIAADVVLLFNVLSTNADGAALAVKLLFASIEGTIISFAFMMQTALLPFTLIAAGIDFVNRGLEEAKRGLHTYAADISASFAFLAPVVVGLAIVLKKIKPASDDAAAGADGLTEAQRKAKVAADAEAAAQAENARQQEILAAAYEKVRAEAEKAAEAIAKSFDESFRRTAGEKDSFLTVQEGFLSLKKNLGDTSTALNDNTQAGIDNEQEILRQVGAIETLRTKSLEHGKSLFEVNTNYSAQLARLRDIAVARGLDAKSVDALLAEYQKFPEQQITDIKAAWAASAHPQELYEELSKIFGEDVVQYIIPKIGPIDQKEFDRSMQKIDPDLFQKTIDERTKDKTGVEVPVNAKKGPTWDAIDATLHDLNTTTVNPQVLPLMNLDAYLDVVAKMNELTSTKHVNIVPVLDPTALQVIRNTLAALSTVSPSTGGSSTPPGRGNLPGNQSATMSVYPRIYLDGDSIRAAFGSDIESSVERATVAATSYRRL